MTAFLPLIRTLAHTRNACMNPHLLLWRLVCLPVLPGLLEGVLEELELQVVPVPGLAKEIEGIVSVDPAEELVKLGGNLK